MKTHGMIRMAGVLLLLTVTAQADWDIGDPHKMHNPQLPDPVGWDVDFTTDFIFDDWQCSESGPVSDVHFWYSWNDDLVGQISRMVVEVWDDVPAGQDPDPQITYSHPGAQLWGRTFYPNEFAVRDAGTGDQGWLAPSFTVPQWNRPDHQNYYQMNIMDIIDPFEQEQDKIYWLGLHLIPEGVGPEAGWKTSQDHFNDDATYYYGGWKELIDPETGVSLDMAFVIVPEPNVIIMVLMSGGGLLFVRRCFMI